MAARRSSGPVLRSLSPSGRFSSTSTSTSTSTSFMSQQSYSRQSSSRTDLFNRSSSPTRINMAGPTSSPSVRIALSNQHAGTSSSTTPRRMCMCAPTTHPGSFRCKLHKGMGMQNPNPSSGRSNSAVSNRLNARRSAMSNSLVRIGSVEGGDWVKRTLAALIRPSSHQQRRRTNFQQRPSRLSAMAGAHCS